MTSPTIRKVVQDRRFLFGLTFLAAALTLLGPLVAYDLWWHLKAGALVLQERAVPTADPFSFTAAGRPWVYHSWLSGVILTLVWRAGDVAGLTLLRALLISGSLMIAWAAATRRGVQPGVASILVLAACVQLKPRALTRPYLFSYVLFALFFLILRPSARRTPVANGARAFAAEDSFLWGEGGHLLLLPILTVLWANLHAGFVSGLLLIGAFGAGEMVRLWAGRDRRPYPAMLFREKDGARFRALLVAGVLCLTAAAVTPYGPGTLIYPFRLMREVKLVARIQEWQPIAFSRSFGIFWSCLILGILIMARSLAFCVRGGRLRDAAGELVTDALLIGGFALLALRAVRHMEWFLLLAPSVFGYHLDASRWLGPGGEGARGEAHGQEGSFYAWAACLLAVVCAARPFILSGRPSIGPSELALPVKACDFIERKGLSYRVYNSYEWGGYFIWRFWPRNRAFIDGRCLVYGDDIIRQAFDVEGGQTGWDDILDRWGIEMLLVRHRNNELTYLFVDDRWRCVYWDDVAIVGLREDLLASRGGEPAEFPLSNPVLFDADLEHLPAADILAEVETVLQRDPECWTALAYRARCLVKLAEERPGEREALLRAALQSARKAVRLQEGDRDPWRALADAAAAVGDERTAARARRKAEKLMKPKKRRQRSD